MSQPPKSLADLLRRVGGQIVREASKSFGEYRQAGLRPPPKRPPPAPADLADFAARTGVVVRLPDDYVRDQPTRDLGQSLDYTRNPCIDFGKFLERVPSFVLAPRDQDELAACLGYLRERAIPFKVRSAGHSSGGQTLIQGGAVVDVSGLDRILEDEPAGERLRVEGGAHWLAVNQHLREQGRCPPILTGNWRTSVAGTLAVGGFGDSSHLRGLQLAGVEQLTVMTLDGARHVVGPGDPLFDYSLAGRGQLGVVTEVSLGTVRRGWQVTAATLRWPSLAAFVADSARIARDERFEMLRARIFYGPSDRVEALAGNFREATELDSALLAGLDAEVGVVEHRDYWAVCTEPPPAHWQRAWPCVELVLPLPEGLESWREIRRILHEGDVLRGLRHGSSVMVIPTHRARFPLAPYAGGPVNMLVALRPKLRLYQCPSVLPSLLRIRDLVLERGGRIYLMSIEPEDGDLRLQQQFGDALPRFVELKRAYDPEGLLNPGLLPSSV